MLTLLNFDKQFSQALIGVDEAGRGSLAGPVVCAAVWLNTSVIPMRIIEQIADSKQLSRQKREQIFTELTALSTAQCAISVGKASVAEIEEFNILQATLRSMSRAIAALKVKSATILIDGLHVPKLDFNTDNKPTLLQIVSGDNKSLSIAAASIIAKVTRDRIMDDLAKLYPYYGWEQNAGYGTKQHLEGMKKHGITHHHRKTFSPVAKLITR